MRRFMKKSSQAIWGCVWVVIALGALVINLIFNRAPMHQSPCFIGYKKLCCGIPYILDQKLNENFLANGVSSQPLPIEIVNRIKAIPEVSDAIPYLLYKIDNLKVTVGRNQPRSAQYFFYFFFCCLILAFTD